MSNQASAILYIFITILIIGIIDLGMLLISMNLVFLGYYYFRYRAYPRPIYNAYNHIICPECAAPQWQNCRGIVNEVHGTRVFLARYKQ